MPGSEGEPCRLTLQDVVDFVLRIYPLLLTGAAYLAVSRAMNVAPDRHRRA